MLRILCWFKGHFWKTDWSLSTDGYFAVVAGLWQPPLYCARCGEKEEGENEQWAGKNGYLKS